MPICMGWVADRGATLPRCDFAGLLRAIRTVARASANDSDPLIGPPRVLQTRNQVGIGLWSGGSIAAPVLDQLGNPEKWASGQPANIGLQAW